MALIDSGLIAGGIYLLYEVVDRLNIADGFISFYRGKSSVNDYELIVGHCNDFAKKVITVDLKVFPSFSITGISNCGKSKLVEYMLMNTKLPIVLINAYEDDFKNGNAIIVYNSDYENVHGFGEEAYAIGKENFDERYSETSKGLSIDCTDIKGRYVRVYGYGSNANASGRNHIVELEVYGHADDPYYNEGIYFTSISDLYNDSMLYDACFHFLYSWLDRCGLF